MKPPTVGAWNGVPKGGFPLTQNKIFAIDR